MSTLWSPCLPLMSASPCHHFPSNTRAATSWPASTPASPARVGLMTSRRRGRMVNWRSEPTFAPPPAASATGPASSSSLSSQRRSAPGSARNTACTHGSGCRDRSRDDNQLSERAPRRGYGRATTETGCPRSYLREQTYARNIRQSLLSKTPVLFADHPNQERASADGVVGWPCLDAAFFCGAMGVLESLWRYDQFSILARRLQYRRD